MERASIAIVVSILSAVFTGWVAFTHWANLKINRAREDRENAASQAAAKKSLDADKLRRPQLKNDAARIRRELEKLEDNRKSVIDQHDRDKNMATVSYNSDLKQLHEQLVRPGTQDAQDRDRREEDLIKDRDKRINKSLAVRDAEVKELDGRKQELTNDLNLVDHELAEVEKRILSEEARLEN